MILTADGLRQGTRCHQIGDFLFLPRPHEPARDLLRLVRLMVERGCYPPEMRELAKKCRWDVGFRYCFWAELQAAYQRLVGIDSDWRRLDPEGRVPPIDPSWLQDAPQEVISYLQWTIGLHGGYGEIFQICGLSKTALFYIVLDDGMVKDVLGTFDVYRLMDIRQLGTLTDPLALSAGRATMSFRYEHSRYAHSLDTAAIGSLMLNNMDELSGDERRHAIVSMLIHDVLTPAHGDGTKLLDPLAFDEDANSGQLFGDREWHALKLRWNLDKETLIAIIQERRQPTGLIKDLADKIAYTARDVDNYVIHDLDVLRHYGINEQREHEEMRRLLKRRPFACGIWDTFRLNDGQVYALDAERLYDFLRLRVLMHQGLYYHPFARFREFIFSNVIVRYLYDTGRLNRKMLLSMTDRDLDRMIEEVVGRPFAIEDLRAMGEPHAMSFASLEAAEIKARALREEGIDFVFIEYLARRIKPGTHLLVRSGDGQLVPFSAAYPSETRRLERLSLIRCPARVYYLTEPDVSDEFRKAYRSYVARQGAQ